MSMDLFCFWLVPIRWSKYSFWKTGVRNSKMLFLIGDLYAEPERIKSLMFCFDFRSGWCYRPI